MWFLAIGTLVMVALVVLAVFAGMGGSSQKRVKNRMDVRGAKLEYLRLARETEAARRREREGASDTGAPDGQQADAETGREDKKDHANG